METRVVALQTEVPVQNTMTKMDILIVTQHCHRFTAAGKITLGENGERRLQNIVILRLSKVCFRHVSIEMDVSHFVRIKKRVQKVNIEFEGRISKAAACACVGNTRDKCTELSQHRSRIRT